MLVTITPYGIFKRKTLPEVTLLRDNHVCRAIKRDWLAVLWNCHPGELVKKKLCLIAKQL